jgi:hypothetical protein
MFWSWKIVRQRTGAVLQEKGKRFDLKRLPSDPALNPMRFIRLSSGTFNCKLFHSFVDNRFANCGWRNHFCNINRMLDLLPADNIAK